VLRVGVLRVELEVVRVALPHPKGDAAIQRLGAAVGVGNGAKGRKRPGGKDPGTLLGAAADVAHRIVVRAVNLSPSSRNNLSGKNGSTDVGVEKTRQVHPLRNRAVHESNVVLAELLLICEVVRIDAGVVVGLVKNRDAGPRAARGRAAGDWKNPCV